MKLQLNASRSLQVCFLAATIAFVVSACTPKIVKPLLLDSGTFLLTEVSDDATYGYTEANPIHVGGAFDTGVKNQQRYLNALLGPNGEQTSYVRLGSCCHFKSKNGFNGVGLLDKYKVTYDGLEEGVVLYVNLYDYDSKPLKAPKGFTILKK